MTSHILTLSWRSSSRLVNHRGQWKRLESIDKVPIPCPVGNGLGSSSLPWDLFNTVVLEAEFAALTIRTFPWPGAIGCSPITTNYGLKSSGKNGKQAVNSVNKPHLQNHHRCLRAARSYPQERSASLCSVRRCKETCIPRQKLDSWHSKCVSKCTKITKIDHDFPMKENYVGVFTDIPTNPDQEVLVLMVPAMNDDRPHPGYLIWGNW